MRIAFFLIVSSLAACGGAVGVGGKLVGANCRVDSDCDHRCVINSHFPNGLCTTNCRSDGDCPNATACVDDAGGICEVQCGAVGGNCGQFGLGFACDMRDRVSGGGQAQVCRVP